MLAERMNTFSGSPTSALIAKVAELRAEGKDIISLNVGEPDFGTPDYIKCGAIKAIVDNFSKYTAGNGIIELRHLISKKLHEDNNLEYTTDEICATVGAKQAIFNSIMALVDPGDEKLIYDDAKHFSIASISKDVWNRTLTVNGFSKAYAMTGWRIGYVAANKTIIDAIKKIQSQTTSATSAISQKAAVAALSGPQHDLEVMVAEFDKRRIYLLQRLAEMPGVSCAKPRGAFYLLPDFSCYFGKKYRGREIKDAVDFANILLEAVLVALVPGEAFNIKGKVRLSYSNSMENLKEAMDRIQSFVRELE